MASTGKSLSRSVNHSFRVTKSCLVHDRPLVNPCWSIDKI